MADKQKKDEPVTIEKPKEKKHRPTQAELIAKLEAELAARKAKIEEQQQKVLDTKANQLAKLEAKIQELNAKAADLRSEIGTTPPQV